MPRHRRRYRCHKVYPLPGRQRRQHSTDPIDRFIRLVAVILGVIAVASIVIGVIVGLSASP